jgi:hypothetical protein
MNKPVDSFSSRMRTEDASKALSENIGEVESELTLLSHSFNKNDLLRVSNTLLAAGRTAGAVSRQAFIEILASWGHTLENGLTKAELKNFSTNFQYMLEREHEKHRLDVNLASIQSSAEKGFVSREQISKMLRALAEEVENGGYPILLVPEPTKEEVLEHVKSLVDS